MSNVPPPPEVPLPPSVPPAQPVDPRKQVEIPAYALMAFGALEILSVFFIIARKIFGLALFGMGTNAGFFASWFFAIIQILVAIALGAFIIFGGMQMKSLRNYNLALAAAVCAMLPCSACCCLGLGAGIWALVILMKPEVKAAFVG